MSSLLCLVAHPDDETILCGGALALLADQGVAVQVACLTRGEGGEAGEPPVCARAELGAVRARELAQAAAHLGVQRLDFLGYVDPEVGPGDTLAAPAHDPAALTGQLAALIEQRRPDVVLTHGSNGEYGHPAHVLMHQVVRAACAALERRPWLYTFAANFPAHPYPRLVNAADAADVVVDVRSGLDRKTAAALSHATQTALFVRRRSQAAGRPLTVREILLPVEGYHRVSGAASGDPFLTWLAPWAVPAAGASG
ncbi:MAG: PIG-L family deacetylase [Anaerolineales bacterium]|nr:PIG-L family deacetylase [Anaerolineales bacterium]